VEATLIAGRQLIQFLASIEFRGKQGPFLKPYTKYKPFGKGDDRCFEVKIVNLGGDWRSPYPPHRKRSSRDRQAQHRRHQWLRCDDDAAVAAAEIVEDVAERDLGMRLHRPLLAVTLVLAGGFSGCCAIVETTDAICWPAASLLPELTSLAKSPAISRATTKLPNPSSGPTETPTVVSVKTINFIRYTALVRLSEINDRYRNAEALAARAAELQRKPNSSTLSRHKAAIAEWTD
jgi:hypothetical protein